MSDVYEKIDTNAYFAATVTGRDEVLNPGEAVRVRGRSRRAKLVALRPQRRQVLLPELSTTVRGHVRLAGLVRSRRHVYQAYRSTGRSGTYSLKPRAMFA